MRPYWLTVLLLAGAAASGQNADVAKQVYGASQDSVFLIYLNDSTGNPDALGSAFLVAPRLLVTNAHVVEAGNPVLAVGPVRIPLRVLRTDKINDLATLSVDVDLTSKPLPLATATVSPGEQIFAIGNPEGLEKTISQGIISGLRVKDGRNLLQITSPISHGSSGGPILNAKGEVVGVAVGMLQDGQNLNFAVPVEYVRTIMTAKADEHSSPADTANASAQLKELHSKWSTLEYSGEASSEYQQDVAQMIGLMKKVTDASNSESELTQVACLGPDYVDLSDDSIGAARKLVRIRPSVENRALLSYTLYKRSTMESLLAAFAKKDSDEEAQANAAHAQLLNEASHEAAEIAKNSRGDTLLIADFVLGQAREEAGQHLEAISLYSPVANGRPQVCGVDLAEETYRDLISESASAVRPDDAETWFRRFASLYQPGPYDWDSEGDRRAAVKDHMLAADAYEKAAGASESLSYDYCFAANEHYLKSVTAVDEVLADGRKCVDASVKQTGKDAAQYFTTELPIVYSDMAEALEERGVYQSALEYIKESLATKPDNPFALNIEAEIFEGLDRYSECIAAAQAAVRASDGKYPWMVFRLGSCYFDTENWSQAATNFQLVANAEKANAGAAFNLGLSLERQGYSSDAQIWFREALKRNPDDALRAKILSEFK
jgi:tetratricopeptide (TPR) repeat protein